MITGSKMPIINFKDKLNKAIKIMNTMVNNHYTEYERKKWDDEYMKILPVHTRFGDPKKRTIPEQKYLVGGKRKYKRTRRMKKKRRRRKRTKKKRKRSSNKTSSFIKKSPSCLKYVF